MSYQVLALKWRPKTFTQVKGQTATLNSLQNSLNSGILHNCYLFTGTRGVGKTTLARILAKSINCAQGLASNPCLVCDNCLSIDEGRNPDVIEVDAASKTKVDDTRELLENITYAPITSRYKIYIIDEVHMLSTHSFNALLKTIEEPPAHVKFILATTEAKKIPITILSRSTQYHLKELSRSDIMAQLTAILTQEQITFSPEAVAYIANLARGSMRDALTSCEQVISYPERNISLTTCESMFGIALEDKILALIELVIRQNKVQALDYTTQLLTENFDLLAALQKMQSLLFSISLLQTINSAQIDWPRERILPLAQTATVRDLQVCYQAVVNGARDLAFVPDQNIAFQMIILRMLSFQAPKQTTTLDPLAQNIQPITTAPQQPTAPLAPVSTTMATANTQQQLTPTTVTPTPPTYATTYAAEPTPESAPAPAPAPAPAKSTSVNWDQLVALLELKGLAKVIADNCVLEAADNNIFKLQLDNNYKPLLTDKIIASVAQGLSLHYNSPIEVSISLQELTSNSPAMRKKQLNDEVENNLKQELINNTNVIALQQVFNATLESIQLIEKS